MGNSPRSIVRDLFRSGRAVPAQWNRWGHMITLTGLLVAAGSVALYFVEHLQGAPVGNLSADLTAAAGKSLHAGMLSTLSTTLWSAAMTIWLLGALLARGRTSSPIPLQFFLTTALFSLLLLMEDALAIHQVLFQDSPQLGERVLFTVNALFMVVYVLTFARQILESEYLFFVAALACFGVAMGIGTMAPQVRHAALVAGCFKIAGMGFWVLYPAVTVPFFLQRVQLLEWSKDTIRVMLGDGRWERKREADLGLWAKGKRGSVSVLGNRN